MPNNYLKRLKEENPEKYTSYLDRQKTRSKEYERRRQEKLKKNHEKYQKYIYERKIYNREYARKRYKKIKSNPEKYKDYLKKQRETRNNRKERDPIKYQEYVIKKRIHSREYAKKRNKEMKKDEKKYQAYLKRKKLSSEKYRARKKVLKMLENQPFLNTERFNTMDEISNNQVFLDLNVISNDNYFKEEINAFLKGKETLDLDLISHDQAFLDLNTISNDYYFKEEIDTFLNNQEVSLKVVEEKEDDLDDNLYVVREGKSSFLDAIVFSYLLPVLEKKELKDRAERIFGRQEKESLNRLTTFLHKLDLESRNLRLSINQKNWWEDIIEGLRKKIIQ